jgi:hypothetical protein
VSSQTDLRALIVRDVCEMDPADPDAPDTVCIRVSDLERIILTRTEADEAATVGDVPFATVRNVVRALSRLGHSFPEGQEEQAARSMELVNTLCREVQAHFDSLTHPHDASARDAERESLLAYKEIVSRLASTREGCIELAKVVHRELDFIDQCITDAIARCEADAALPSPPKGDK